MSNILSTKNSTAMTEAFETIVHSLQHFFETSYEVLHRGFNVAYTFVWGLLVMLWHTLESFAEFLGASVNFVVSNIVILILVIVGFIVYRSRAPVKARSSGKKKVE